MASKLGIYATQPDLFGALSVTHAHSTLSGTYENMSHFLHECQKHDWPIFISACNKAVNAAYKVYSGGYIARNAGNQFMVVNTINKAIPGLSRMNPVDQARAVRYMLDMLPLFARVRINFYGRDINEALETIQDYFTRYLEKYATYDNSFLTA